MRADCTLLADIAALFDRVEREQGKLDVLANAVWGGADAFGSVEDCANRGNGRSGSSRSTNGAR